MTFTLAGKKKFLAATAGVLYLITAALNPALAPFTPHVVGLGITYIFGEASVDIARAIANYQRTLAILENVFQPSFKLPGIKPESLEELTQTVADLMRHLPR